MNFFNDKEEKKVEYMELIYDLIFVYMISRENSLLHSIHGGFVSSGAAVIYVVSTLAIIQIWNFTTFYVNLYGRNGIRDHVFLIINMYLIYFIGESTRNDWAAYQTQYHIAWGLIILNIGIQYWIELRNHQIDVWNRDLIKRMALILFIEAGLVFIAAVPNPRIGVIFSIAAILGGMFMSFFIKITGMGGGTIDFMHLTERAMLFVVFTFGEMVIAVAAYFKGNGNVHWNMIYFSMMAFLIAVGLFLGYEVIYDHLIDRNGEHGNVSGLGYMLIHIFIIFALNCITVSFEFMNEEKIAVGPKVLMMTFSIVIYFVFLFILCRQFKHHCEPDRPFNIKVLLLTVAFAIAMFLLRHNMYLNILATVLYVFSILVVLYRMKEIREDIRRHHQRYCESMIEER